MAAPKPSIDCAVCSKPYVKATMLECVHSFCFDCVINTLIKDNKIVCPTCNTPSKVPPNDAIVSNLYLDNQVTMASIRMKEDLECQNCIRDERKAVEFCQRCPSLLCKACVENHKVAVGFKEHQRIDINKFKSGNFNIKPLPVCSKHHEELVKCFCLQHDSLLCEECKMDEHADCKVQSLGKTASQKKDELQKIVEPLGSAIKELHSKAEENEEMRKKVQDSKIEVDQTIDQCFDKLKDALEKRRELLKQKCFEIAQEKDEILADQLTETKKFNEEFVFLQEQVQSAMSDHYSLEELLSVKKVMKQRATKRLEDYGLADWSLRENKFIDIYINEIDTIENDISSIGFFGNVPEPDNCSVEGLVVPEAAIGFNREFKVILKNEKNEVIKGKGAIQYTLEKAPGVPETQVNSSLVQTIGATILHITPKVAGDLIVTIKVRNKTLKKFPFHLKVRQVHSYTALPTNPTMFPLNSSPGNSLTVNGEHIYVTTPNSIEVLNSNGSSLKIHQKNLSNPWGVAVVQREMYVTNRGTHDVRVFAIAGEFVRTFGGNGSGDSQFNDPRGICSDGNGRILIADYGNRRIQVYSCTKSAAGKLQETFLYSISCSSNPIDVAVDVSGKIHVALGSADVEVFSYDGVAYQSIEKYNVGGAPTGVFVDVTGYRFVTESSNNQLHIFDSNGKEVAAALKSGCSGGVGVDSKGTVYANTPNSAQINKF